MVSKRGDARGLAASARPVRAAELLGDLGPVAGRVDALEGLEHWVAALVVDARLTSRSKTRASFPASRVSSPILRESAGKKPSLLLLLRFISKRTLELFEHVALYIHDTHAGEEEKVPC